MTKSQTYTLESIQSFTGKYPVQLWYLFLIEMWERFTFYGMRALLTLYISHLILSNGYVQLPENELKEAKIRFESTTKETLSPSHPRYYIETSNREARNKAESTSNRRYGTIQAFIYAMAFLGGLLADRIFGSRRSVIWGGCLMAIGTFLMAVPGAFTFYLGISILIVGNGFFKPNISTMVGALYKPGDGRRDAGFSLFYAGINAGALLSGLTIAYLGTSVSWSLGFALAGVFMVLGLGLFFFTQRTLGPIGLSPNPEKLNSNTILYYGSTLGLVPLFFVLVYYPFDIEVGNFTLVFTDLIFLVAAVVIISYIFWQIRLSPKDEANKLTVASVLILFSALFWSFFEQGGGSLNFFAVGNVNSQGWNMTQVNNSINALWVILLGTPIGLFWVWLNRRGSEPNLIVKFGLGFLFLGAGFLIFYVSRFFADSEGMVPLLIFVSAYLIITIGELCLSPIGLSMVTKLTPARLNGVMMGTWFLASAYGQYGAGLIGAALGDSGSLDSSNYAKLIAYTDGYRNIGLIAICAGLILILISPFLKRMMGGVR
jgi:POT family proton-dependent oligopeptide transporter